MLRFWKWIRVSGIGVFFTGIIGVIQGCTEREGALLVALAFLLNFCNAPITNDVTPASLPIGPIDLFTTPFSFSDVCVDAPTTQDLSSDNSFLFGKREIRTNGLINADANQIDITVGGGSMTFTHAPPGTNNMCNVLMNYPQSGTEGATIDVSSFAKVAFDVDTLSQLASDNINCRAIVDVVKTPSLHQGFHTPNSTGAKSIYSTIYPYPTDTTSFQFDCTLQPGASIGLSNLRFAGQLIDDFTAKRTFGSSCGTQASRNRTIVNHFQDIDTRDMFAGSNTGVGTSTMNFVMLGSAMLVTAAGGTGCDYPDDPIQGPISRWSSTSSDDNTDFSQAGSIVFGFNTFLSLGTDDVTDCYLDVQDSGGSTIETVGPVTPTLPEMVFTLSGSPALAAANGFTLYGCNFATNGFLNLTAPHVMP